MNKTLRSWKASWRDTVLLLREFRGPLFVFSLAVGVASFIYFTLAQQSHEPIETYIESVYLMLTLAFLQPSQDFPNQPALQIFFFVMPIVGAVTLALGLADFGILLFNRRARNKEWEMAIASTMSKHHVLIGLGHLGFRVAEQLHDMGEEITAIELSSTADMTEILQRMGVPVIQDDASRETALEGANIRKAKSIILCTQNDALNLKIALKARSLNPTIQVVIRIFDDEFAQALHDQFGFTALSATGIAAPAFAASASGVTITSPISIEGEAISLARLTVGAKCPIAEKTVGFVEDHYHVSIILVREDNNSDLHPADGRVLHSGDQLAALGKPQQLRDLLHDTH
jgi:Trk K+ transport system NAD-binding subunit